MKSITKIIGAIALAVAITCNPSISAQESGGGGIPIPAPVITKPTNMAMITSPGALKSYLVEKIRKVGGQIVADNVTDWNNAWFYEPYQPGPFGVDLTDVLGAYNRKLSVGLIRPELSGASAYAYLGDANGRTLFYGSAPKSQLQQAGKGWVIPPESLAPTLQMPEYVPIGENVSWAQITVRDTNGNPVDYFYIDGYNSGGTLMFPVYFSTVAVAGGDITVHYTDGTQASFDLKSGELLPETLVPGTVKPNIDGVFSFKNENIALQFLWDDGAELPLVQLIVTNSSMVLTYSVSVTNADGSLHEWSDGYTIRQSGTINEWYKSLQGFPQPVALQFNRGGYFMTPHFPTYGKTPRSRYSRPYDGGGGMGVATPTSEPAPVTP